MILNTITMFFGKQTTHRIKTVLDLYGIGCYSSTGKSLLFLLKLSAIIIPFTFAFLRFEVFEISFLNILKFLGWFFLAHFIYEGVILSILLGILIRIKN